MPASAPIPSPLHAAIDAAATALEPRMIEWRRDLHAHPELGNREFRTAGIVAAHLRSLGFDDVRTEVAVTGVVGLLKGKLPGPVVALRADMDGLPGHRNVGGLRASIYNAFPREGCQALADLLTDFARRKG